MNENVPDPEIPALGVRQPWAELILRGTKTVEIRSQPTQVRGTIYVYASQKMSNHPDAVSAQSLYDVSPETLLRGVVIGTVEVEACEPAMPDDAAAACLSPSALTKQFAWRLSNPQRFSQPLTVRFLPYCVWFYPWRRKTSGRKGKRKST